MKMKILIQNFLSPQSNRVSLEKMSQIKLFFKKFHEKISSSLKFKVLPGKEFNLQMKMINFCGIFYSSSIQWKILSKIIQLINIFVNFYSLLTLLMFSFENYTKVYDVAESIGLMISVTIGFARYLILIYRSDEFFDMIFKIRILNERCKQRNYFFYFLFELCYS